MPNDIGPYLPRITPDAALYWEGAKLHELRYQVCGNCRAVVFHARSVCPYCLGEDLECRVSKGLGRVYSFTVLHRAPTDAYTAKIPYVLAIVELDEGFHMFTELLNFGSERVEIGHRVRLVFDRLGPDLVLPKFEPARDVPSSDVNTRSSNTPPPAP